MAELAPAPDPAVAPSPIAGAPALRRVERLDAGVLTLLWHYPGHADVGASLRLADMFRLWESPTGLIFLDPPVAGDAAFDRAFHGRIAAHDKLAGPEMGRLEFLRAAARVPPGARVLAVGRGRGGFRAYVPNAADAGRDPNFSTEDPTGTTLGETAEAHATRVGPVYDVACTFQVIEVAPGPLGFALLLAARKSARPLTPRTAPRSQRS